jgi:hypothetical protein
MAHDARPERDAGLNVNRRECIGWRQLQRARAGLVVAAALASVLPQHAQAPSSWPDTFLARLEALALIQTLNAEILAIPDALFEHRAVLYTRDHKPFAEVREVYQRQILASAPRAPLE